MEIDKKFWEKLAYLPVAHTVGDLRRILSELPDDLMLSGDFEVGVFNYLTEGLETVCAISEIDPTDDDDIDEDF